MRKIILLKVVESTPATSPLSMEADTPQPTPARDSLRLWPQGGVRHEPISARGTAHHQEHTHVLYWRADVSRVPSPIARPPSPDSLSSDTETSDAEWSSRPPTEMAESFPVYLAERVRAGAGRRPRRPPSVEAILRSNQLPLEKC